MLTQKQYLMLVEFKGDWWPEWNTVEMMIGGRGGAKRIFTFKGHEQFRCKVALSKSQQFIKEIKSRKYKE